MAQDGRLALFGAGTGHDWIGLDYLPAVARHLLHCRDLGEPFDLLTWYEFARAAPRHSTDLLFRLPAIPEWSFCEREIKVRLECPPG